MRYVKICVGVLLCKLGIHRWSMEYLIPPKVYYKHCHRCPARKILRESCGHDYYSQG